jgi:DmsE family decaheme c-type cytochrome
MRKDVKVQPMTRRLKLLCLLVSLGLCVSTAAYGQNSFRLKPDAGGKQCLTCHDAFKSAIKKAFVHTPVKTGQCVGCHDPHTSSHGKMLSQETSTICIKCHKALLPDNAKSTHKVVVEGNCVKCHDPHASDYKDNLVKSGNSLCFGCHKAMGERIGKAKFKHSPVEKGCTNCHDPHASSKADHLLANNIVALCTKCHKTNSPNFEKQHMGYPMANARCTACHDPHGSNKPGLFLETVHSPVAKKMCTQCHEPSNSAAPFKTKKTGLELCKDCHSAVVSDAMGKNKIHWPFLDKQACLNCHTPHASAQKGLLFSDSKNVCGKCHPDTISLQTRLADKEAQETAAAGGRVLKGALTHVPVRAGNCSACHSPHGSDNFMLLNKPSPIELCGACHDWLKHTSHPMGEKTPDLRNKNLHVDCLSCHKSHGTGYRHMITTPTTTDLCVQCHKQYRR